MLLTNVVMCVTRRCRNGRVDLWGMVCRDTAPILIYITQRTPVGYSCMVLSRIGMHLQRL